jgi:hypothetical protein
LTWFDVRRDRVPVVRHDRPEIEHRDADVVLFSLVCGDERALHQSAPRDDEHMIPFALHVRAAERNHEVFALVLTLVVRLAIEVLVLEEEDGIVAPNRGSQQTGRVDGVRRKRDANAGAVREDALARLAVVRTAAAQVAADRRANDDRTRPVVA